MMGERERRELAADIAARVRMFSWSPLPPELAEVLGERGFMQRQMLYAQVAGAPPAVEVVWHGHGHGSVPRLEVAFIHPNGERLARLLWTPEHGGPQ